MAKKGKRWCEGEVEKKTHLSFFWVSNGFLLFFSLLLDFSFLFWSYFVFHKRAVDSIYLSTYICSGGCICLAHIRVTLSIFLFNICPMFVSLCRDDDDAHFNFLFLFLAQFNRLVKPPSKRRYWVLCQVGVTCNVIFGDKRIDIVCREQLRWAHCDLHTEG